MEWNWKGIFAASITVGILFTLVGVPVLTAQEPSTRSVDVTVTDPYGRTVAGLEKGQFAVTEDGVERMITAFSELRGEDPKPGVHYRLEYESAATSASVEVALNPPRGLPRLTLTWK